jgi:hypothetical protein
LAIFALSKINYKQRRILFAMIFGVVSVIILSATPLLKIINQIWPAVAGIRQVPVIAGLSIPLVLGLSAYGLEKLLLIRWPIISINNLGSTTLQNGIKTKWIIAIPLLFSLYSCYRFSQVWLATEKYPDDVYSSLEFLKTDDLQWVEPPFGIHTHTEPATDMGLKMSPIFTTWWWKDRPYPKPVISMVVEGNIPPNGVKLFSFAGFDYYSNDEAPRYAEVVFGEESQPCQAHGSGGFIEVTCNLARSGQLVIQENMWDGWQAWIDGRKVELVDEQLLKVNAPAGNHKFLFRYLPWDVPLGILLMLIGIVISIGIWLELLPLHPKR